MQNINAFDHAETILKVLAKGAFLTTAAGGRHNTMTIGWGALGNIWGKPVFTVMVRHSRYTHELIEAHNELAHLLHRRDHSRLSGQIKILAS